jgi:hypothetical protein
LCARHGDEAITITRSGSLPFNKGPDQYFTGSVRVDPLFPAAGPSRVSAGLVTFEPGARSASHTHPLGKLLSKSDSRATLMNTTPVLICYLALRARTEPTRHARRAKVQQPIKEIA